ncbi:9720_t:CDS:2, partial [Dentiscutata erythropus]
KENKYIMRTDNTQYPQKINVWAGIINNFIISLFFIERNLNGPKYLEILQNLIIPELNNLFSRTEIIFQQDGAPAYFSKDGYLKTEVFKTPSNNIEELKQRIINEYLRTISKY